MIEKRGRRRRRREEIHNHHSHLVRAVLLLVVVVVYFAVGSSGLKVEQLKEESERNGFVELNTANLKKLVESQHNYSLVVLFSTESTQFPCPLCGETNTEFLRLLESFTLSLGGERFHSALWQQHPLFLALCRLEHCSDLFLEAGWRTIPKLVHIPPRKEKGPFKFSLFEDMNELVMENSAEKMAKFIREHVEYPLEIKESWTHLLRNYGMYIGILLVAGWALFPKLKAWYKLPLFWFAMSMGVYCFTMAGTVFNSIHKPPMSYRHPENGMVYWIYPAARMQFVAEGLILAALLSFISVLAISVTAYLQKINKWKQRISFVFIVIMFWYSSTWLTTLFRVKHRWYPY